MKEKKILSQKKLHNILLKCFKWGKYCIIYGSIILLTLTGIFIWIIGTINLFFLIFKSFHHWQISIESIKITLQQFETNVIIMLDIYLLSIVLFIVAIGLYGIFLQKDKDKIRLPVDINNINELERYLFGTIVAILIVTCLDKILYPGEIPLKDNLITVTMICATIIVISIYLAINRAMK